MNRRTWNILAASSLVLAAVPGPVRAAAAKRADYVAFSLREASRRAKAATLQADAMNLGGITRIVGMVHDPAGDIVLVGRRLPGRPALTLDDLAVALRARILRNEWPTVSIDPDEDTAKSRTQRVSFVGGIAQTALGRDFLRADIYLKRYSLLQLPLHPRVPSFAAMVGDAERRTMRAAGPVELRWIRLKDEQDSVPELDAVQVKQESSHATRFWFFARNPRMLVRDGVYCIDELRVGIQAEEVAEQPDPGLESSSKATADAAAGFARAAELHVDALTAQEPALHRIKGLYDLVAVAEGIRALKVRPEVDHLLHSHRVSAVATPQRHELIQMVGLLGHGSAISRVLTVSGGVSFAAQLQWLNDGDVSPLREIVLKTRPAADSLTWTLPLDAWKMPNAQDLDPVEAGAGAASAAGRNEGFVLSTRSLAVEPGGRALAGAGIDGLPMPRAVAMPHVASPRFSYLDPVGGVTMEPGEWNVTRDRAGELGKIKARVLGVRPGGELSWPQK